MLDAFERPAVDGTDLRTNAFDQYVPGFGVTFLLIGMMLGLSLTLFDERDWGTLERVRAGGASLAGILIGKVLARAVVGVVQMLVLFGVGWALFDVTLGRTPAALLLPMVSMAFAGAALGLVIPSLAPAHDSVMPLGTMTSLAMAAIGGCWWPLDFEPAWMRTLAHWLPTTWTMRAYNDLMIRGAPASAALLPFVVTTAIGGVVLAIGVAAALRSPRSRN
jgi:ABC-2 type transport system permease protein